MRNWLLFFIIMGFLAVGGWYAWLNVNRESLSNQRPASQAVLPSLAENAAAVPSDHSQKTDLLKAEALKIISSPIAVKIPIADSSRKNALAKIEELIKLIKEKYDYVNAWYDLGAYRMIIGDYEGAVDSYKFVIAIKPNDYVSYGNLGDIYGFYLKNYPLAEENFLKAIKNNPAYSFGYSELALLYENNFNDGWQKAEDLFLSGIKSNPSDLYLKIRLAEFYERNGRKLESLGLFREILSLDPGNKSVEAKIIKLSN